MPSELANLAVHTASLPTWDLATCLDHLVSAGVGGVSIWPDAYAEIGIDAAAAMVRQSGLRVPTLAGGGLFVANDDAGRRAAIERNLRRIDEAEALGAEVLTLLPGGGAKTLEAGCEQVAAGIEALLPHAEQTGVKLALEPLHPMFAADRACVNRLSDARALCEQVEHPLLGVAVDAWHVWWDSQLHDEIAKLGAGNRLFTYHISDWIGPAAGRGLPGEGVIGLQRLGQSLREAGFEGMDELEILGHAARPREDGSALLADLLRSYRTHC